MSGGELILYEAEDGAHVQLRASQGTIWLTQAEIAELYGSSPQNVQQTIVRVLADGEVDESAINSELMVRTEGTRQVRREVKNKMLWAVTSHTAGESVRKADVVTSKNYLASDEIRELDRIVTTYLDYAEDQAKRRQSMTMADWAQRLDAFLAFNDRQLLTHAGTVQAKVAKALAEERYAEFDSARRQRAALEADATDLDTLRAIERKLEDNE